MIDKPKLCDSIIELYLYINEGINLIIYKFIDLLCILLFNKQ